MADIIPWIATFATIAAASMTAANLGTRITGYGFCVFLAGSLAWLAAGLLTSQPALVWTNIVLTALNIFGIWRWLGRQATLEQGARTAAQDSAAAPGEMLFPVSLFGSAPVESQGRVVGRCVDAMAGASSGRLAYVVLSDGGIAGVGETLRRADWSELAVDAGQIRLRTSAVEALPAIAKGEWPGR